jgi:hypothetical protein
MQIFVWVRIRIGSGFSSQLDPNPDSSKYLDPGSGFNKYGFETMTAARLQIRICIILGS